MGSKMRTLIPVLCMVALLAGCGGGKSTQKPDDKATAGASDSLPANDRIKQEKKGDESVTEFDLNGDKKPDAFVYTVRAKREDGKEYDRLSRKELDINWDGKIDISRTYDEKEQLVKESLDLDFDGRVDQVNFYEKGAIVRKERDLTSSGKISEWVYFEKGHIVRKERDNNGDGKIDYWEYWEGDQVDRVGEDLDGDGNVDKWTKNPNSEQ